MSAGSSLSVIPNKMPVTMVGKPHPLRMSTVSCEIPEGQTLAEMLAGINPDYVQVRVNGARFDKETFKYVRPKQGSLVEVVAFPQGEFQNQRDADKFTQAGTIGLSIVAIIAAAAITAATAGLAGGPIIAGLVSLAISTGGALVLGSTVKVAPIKPPPQARQFYGIEGSKNVARPYAPVPVVLGQVRMVPPLLSEPISEWIGSTSTWTYLMVDFGYGDLVIDQVTLDDTAIEDYDENIRWLVGETPAWGMGDSYTTTPNKALPANGDPVASNPTETTQVGTQLITCEIVFQQSYFIQSGNTVTQGSSEFEVYYRAVGSGTWLPVANLSPVTIGIDLAPGEFTVLSTAGTGQWGRTSGTLSAPWTQIRVLGAATPQEPLIITIMFRPPAAGQYEVICTRSTLSTAGFQDAGGVWTKCRSVNLIATPATLPTTKGSLTLAATKEITGTLGVLSARVGQSIPTWNGTAWVDAVSSNPAFIYRWLLTECPATLKLVPAERIDDDAIKAWATFCTTKGFVFNEVIDEPGTLFDLLQKVAAAGRATVAIRDGKYSIVVDDTQLVPVQMFTPRNSKNFSGTRTFANTIHGLSCRFPNKNAGYQTDLRIVYATGYSKDGAGADDVADPKLLPEMDMPGVTEPDAVWKLAKYHIAVAQNRQNMYTFDTGIENLVCQRGDRIRMVHDVTDWGAGWGRVKDVRNLFLAFSSGLNGDPGISSFPGDIAVAAATNTYGCKFVLGADADVYGLRFELSTTGSYYFSIWGASSTPLYREQITVSSGMRTVYFRQPVHLSAGEYCLSVYSPINGTYQDLGYTMHATARQSGPLFIPQDAGVMLAGDNNPISSSGSAKGYRIEPIVVADISAIPPSLDALGAGVLQQFTLDEQPESPFIGAGTYNVLVRNGVDPRVNTSYADAIPENVSRAISAFSRASPTGSYIDANGYLQYTNVDHTQRHTYDSYGNFVGLMVEKATTNECLNSDDLSQWTKNNTFVTTNQKVWSNEVGSADRVSVTDDLGTHSIECNTIAVASQQFIGASIFLKKGTTDQVLVGCRRYDGSYTEVHVNLSTGVATPVLYGGALLTEGGGILLGEDEIPLGTEPSGDSPIDYRVENRGNDWWRVSMIGNMVTLTGDTKLRVTILNTEGTEWYAGDGQSIYAVGGQMEIGPWVTSYLPSGGVVNTRAAESATLNVPTKYGRKGGLHPYEGSVVFEVDLKSLNLGSYHDVFLQFGAWATYVALHQYEGWWVFGTQAGAGPSLPQGGRGITRVVMTWRQNVSNAANVDLILSVNGVQATSTITLANLISATSADVLPALGSAMPGFGSFDLRKLHLYDYAFTDAQALAYSTVGAAIPDENAIWAGGVSTTTGNAAVGDLVMLGRGTTESKDLLVTQVSPSADLTASITCVEYEPTVYTADSGTPPAFTSTITTVPYRVRLDAPTVDNWAQTVLSPNNGSAQPPYRLFSTVFHARHNSNQGRVARLEVTYRLGYSGVAITFGDLGLVVNPTFTDVEYGPPWPASVYRSFSLQSPPSWMHVQCDELQEYAFGGNTMDDYGYCDMFCRLVATDGSTSLWRHARTPIRRGETYNLAGTIGAQIGGGQLTASALTATPGVNGIDLSWTVTNPTVLQNRIASTILRAPDVAGVAGTYVTLDTQLVAGGTRGMYRDPVTDGSTYWYKVSSTLTFSALAPVESTPTKVKAMQVTDGADVTGNAVLIRVKNPSFDEGDVSWIKGTNWSILVYP